MSARSWHKYLVSLLGAFQVGQIDSMGIAGTLSGSKFFCYDSTGTPVKKGQGNSFSCCASPWRPPSISSQPALKPIDLLQSLSLLAAHCELSQGRTHRSKETSTQARGKHYRKEKCCNEVPFTSFSISVFVAGLFPFCSQCDINFIILVTLIC